LLSFRTYVRNPSTVNFPKLIFGSYITKKRDVLKHQTLFGISFVVIQL
jgi:hypothetical protein